MRRPDVQTAAACAALAVVAALLAPAKALPPPPAPPAAATASPTPTPNAAAYLPVGSPIEFVLDDGISSRKTQPGSDVRLHLSHDLIVGGVVLAKAGSPATMRVVSTRPAQAPDTVGAVQVDISPLVLPNNRGTLPVQVTKSYITVDETAGQQSTRGLMDTVEDIFFPPSIVYQATRKGRELVLPAGTVVRARLAASIDATHAPTVVIATPPPFVLNTDTPHAGFTPIPLYTVPTPPARHTPTPAPKPAATATPATTSATAAAPATPAATTPSTGSTTAPR